MNLTVGSSADDRNRFPLLASRTINGRSLVLVVAAGSIITSIGLGTRATFGLFLTPVTETLGTGRGMFGLAIAIQNIIWGLSQPIAGAIADRFGAAKTLAVGGIGYGLALLVISTATGSGVFYLSAGVMVGLATGAASFSIVLASVGRMAPPEKASMALGVVTAMGSVGQFLLIPVAGSLIDEYGWRTAFVVLAAVVASIALFVPFLRGRAIDQQGELASTSHGEATPLRHELRRAVHSRAYLLLNMAFFVCGFHVTFIATHFVAYGGDVGISESIARTGLMLIGLFNIAGSLTAGYLGGRRPKTQLLSAIYLARAVVLTAFVLVPVSEITILAFGATFGLLWLSTVPLTGGIVAGLFGTTHSGTLFGFVFLSHQMGAFLGAFFGGVIADRVGSYEPVWWIAVALGLFAAVVHQFIDESPASQPPPARNPSTGLAAAATGG